MNPENHNASGSSGTRQLKKNYFCALFIFVTVILYISVRQYEDNDVILIEPEIPVIDLCAPCENDRNNRLYEQPMVKSSPTNLKDKTIAAAQGQKSASLLCKCCSSIPFDRKPYVTACGHVFCLACIRRALIFKKECPLCLAFLTTKAIVPLQ